MSGKIASDCRCARNRCALAMDWRKRRPEAIVGVVHAHMDSAHDSLEIRVIVFQSPPAMADFGATQDPPTHTTFGRER